MDKKEMDRKKTFRRALLIFNILIVPILGGFIGLGLFLWHAPASLNITPPLKALVLISTWGAGVVSYGQAIQMYGKEV